MSLVRVSRATVVRVFHEPRRSHDAINPLKDAELGLEAIDLPILRRECAGAPCQTSVENHVEAARAVPRSVAFWAIVQGRLQVRPNPSRPGMLLVG
jgi:hypothetical protein